MSHRSFFGGGKLLDWAVEARNDNQMITDRVKSRSPVLVSLTCFHNQELRRDKAIPSQQHAVCQRSFHSELESQLKIPELGGKYRGV